MVKAKQDTVYELLFTPITINGMELENRIVMAPAHEGMMDEEGYITPAYNDYYFRRAQGGPGMIVLGGILVNPRRFPAPRLSDDKCVPAYKNMIGRIHSETNTKMVAQLYDLLKSARGWRQSVEEVPIEQMKQSIDFFESGAIRAREAGFDAVEIHAAHGVLQADFLSLKNKRKGEYGGKKLENRMRLTVEVYERVRKALGKDYPIGIRINGDEFITGGTTMTQSTATAAKLAELGLDYISVSVGGKYDDSYGADPWGLAFPYPPWGGYSGFRCMPEKYMPEATNIYIAEAIRKAVRDAGYDTPIMGAGRITTPKLAEKLLQEERIDLAGVCRQIIRDPDWPKKAKEGREKEIKKCAYCNNCIETATVGPGGYCKLDKEKI
ncbi:MAG: NADH:flavin oxidoreductase [Chloroflexi bacterium]|nr:NADH:flavin oxidoreductase [Chloroflexota bacterium]